MKIGMRTPSPTRSLKARTTGRVKRTAKKAINPVYGRKGMGYLKNPVIRGVIKSGGSLSRWARCVEEDEFFAKLPEIDTEAEYEIQDFMTGTTCRIFGRELRYYKKVMPEKRSVSLIFYHKL